MFERLELTAIKRRSTVSAIAAEILTGTSLGCGSSKKRDHFFFGFFSVSTRSSDCTSFSAVSSLSPRSPLMNR